MKLFSFIGKYIYPFMMGVVGLGIAALLFFILFPFNVAEFKNITVKDNVTSGGILEYTNEYCQNVGKGTKRDISRFLIAKDPTLLSPTELSTSPEDETQKDAGCYTSAPIKLALQSNIPEGEYKLRVKACYYVFFNIRCVEVSKDSEYFRVEKPTLEAQLGELNDKIDSLNQQLATHNSPIFVNTVTIPTMREIQTPSQPNTQPSNPNQPNTPNQPPSTPVNPPAQPQQACVINVLGIKLLCN